MKRLAMALVGSLVLASPSQGANRVTIDPSFGLYCGTVDINIRIENDVDLQSLYLPLIARNAFGAFWRDSVVMLPPLGRLAASLSDVRRLDKGNIDFTDPDEFALYFESSTPGVNCLPAGPLEHMITLRAGVLGAGIFEIDTASTPPCYNQLMFRCADYAPIPLDAFQQGYVELFPDGHVIIDFQNDPVVGTAGDVLQNQTIALDPEGDPVGFFLRSGPGEVNPNTGLWTWASCTPDSGNYTVEIEVYQKFCGPGTGPSGWFQVQVLPHDPADVNCDGVADAVDLAISIDHIFFGQNIPPCN